MRENILSERYGVGKNAKRDRVMAISIAVFGLVAFLIWAIIFTIDDSSRVTSRDAGFQVIDQYSTTVVFEVSRPVGQLAFCDITVLSESFAIVGFKTVLIEPSTSKATVISTTVNTTELGVSGLVDSCR